MKKVGTYYLAFALLLVTGFLSAQDREDRKVGSFSAIRAGEGIDVYLKKGSKEAVTVESDDVDLDRIETRVSGSTLKIELDGNNRNYDITVYVTFVSLNEISVSSAGNIYSESIIEGDELELSASSAGNLELEVRVDRLYVSSSSSGDLELEGTANYMKGTASSAGDINAYDLEVKNVEVRASSAGSIRVYATERIEASASSAGSIRYRGSPKKSNNSSSSGGSVKKSN